ncbi:MAG: universal stress protein [Elusimicrobia bacterium]|nr:universal stress protein [Elusimicrobiota bacterium]
MYRRIVVALDGSALAERVLPDIESLAEAAKAEVVLVTAIASLEMVLAQTSAGDTWVPPPAIDAEKTVDAARRDADASLRSAAERLKSKGIDVRTQVLEGVAEECILEAARERGADLIALTSHGRSGLDRAVFGSVADAVIRKASCPVLVVPVREAP